METLAVSPQEALNIVVGLLGMLGGAVLRATWSAIEEMRREVAAIQKSNAETYVRRDDFRDHAERIESILERIESKLDTKVDKP
jgi:hypothetical protein